jgi:hypothetical protein
VQVTVPELEKLPETATHEGNDMKPLPTGPGVTTTATTEPSNRKMIGMYVGGSGLAVAAGGLVFGYLAMSKHSDAKNACSPGTLDMGCANFDAANSAENSAKTYGNVSTVLVGVGAAAIVTGVVLYLTAPSDGPAEHASVQVAPTVTPDGFALTAVGSF